MFDLEKKIKECHLITKLILYFSKYIRERERAGVTESLCKSLPRGKRYCSYKKMYILIIWSFWELYKSSKIKKIHLSEWNVNLHIQNEENDIFYTQICFALYQICFQSKSWFIICFAFYKIWFKIWSFIHHTLIHENTTILWTSPK